MALKLYHHPVSTCSQKVRLVLAEKNLAFESHVIDWTIMEHLEPWYLALNPNGVVPTLIHDDKPVGDSSVICEYLDDVFPTQSVAPDDHYGKAIMREWMRYFEEVPTTAIRAPSFNTLFIRELKDRENDAEFLALTDKLPLRKHFYRLIGDKGFSEKLINESLERLRQCLERVSNVLSDGRSHICGDDYSIADVLLVPTVVRMEDIGLAYLWDDVPRMAEWFERIQARPSFDIAYMPGSRVDPNAYLLSQGNSSK